MKSKLHVYHWDDEPVDERPSEFSSTGFSTMSGYRSSMHGRHRVRPSSRVGPRAWITIATLVVGFGAWALYAFARMRGH